jgi:tRNA (cmo5U34)-methyltransferase
MTKDMIFRGRRRISDFAFGKETVEVFDDMLVRSVPFYEETQRMLAEMAADFAKPRTRLYDLGCSTGTSFVWLDPFIDKSVTFVGVDSSKEMLKKADAKLRNHRLRRRFELQHRDLNKEFEVRDASVVLMNLTLQFVRPLQRERVVRTIADGLNDGGCLLLVEKLLSPNSTLNRSFIRYYYDFKKRNGYTELEIAQKREALENVLIPYHFDENRELLLRCGFRACEMFFRWYNFSGIVAIK